MFIKKILCSGLLVLYVGLLFLQLISNKDFYQHDDSFEQAMVGRSLWEGNGIQLNGHPYVVLPPGLSVIIGGMDLIVKDLEWSGKAATLASFFVCLFLIYRIASFFFKEDLFIFITVILFAANSNTLINAINGRSESLFTAVCLGLVYITLRWRDPAYGSVLKMLMFAVLWAFLYYVRPEGFVAGGILFLWILWYRRFSWRKNMLLFLAPPVFFIFIFPYLLFLKESTGRWQLSGKTYINLVMGELKSPYQTGLLFDEHTAPRYFVADQVTGNPLLAKGFGEYWNEPDNDIIGRIPHNLFRLGTVYGLTFSMAGLLLCFWGSRIFSRPENMFLLSSISVVLLYVIFFILPRSVAIYHWVICIYLAAGLKAWELFLESRLKNKSKDLLFYAPLALLVLYEIRSVLKTSYLYLLT